MPLEVPDYINESLIVVSNTAQLPWDYVRTAIAVCTQKAAADARVHKVWKLGFDLTKNVALLKGVEGADLEKVHAWMVGIASAEQNKTPQGQATVTGRAGFEWNLTFAVWGFIGYSLAASTDKIEREARLVATTLSKTLGLGLRQPYVQALHSVGPLDYTSIDNHSFAEGYDVHVAQGRMLCRIDENI